MLREYAVVKAMFKAMLNAVSRASYPFCENCFKGFIPLCLKGFLKVFLSLICLGCLGSSYLLFNRLFKGFISSFRRWLRTVLGVPILSRLI